MRQLVSVVTDQGVAYFITDEHGDNSQQIAQTINPGFDVPAVISLASNLVDALGLNGKRRPTPPAIAVPAPEPAPPAELTTKGKRRKRAAPTKPRRDWGLTMDDVLAYVIEHPGAISQEIAQALLGTTEHGAMQCINNSLHRLRSAGEVRYGEREGHSLGGHRRMLRTVTATLPPPPASEST